MTQLILCKWETRRMCSLSNNYLRLQTFVPDSFERIDRDKLPSNKCCCSLPGSCKPEPNTHPVQEGPGTAESWQVTSDASKDTVQQKPKSPGETQSSLDRERELARKKEQERRRREAVSSSVPE